MRTRVYVVCAPWQDSSQRLQSQEIPNSLVSSEITWEAKPGALAPNIFLRKLSFLSPLLFSIICLIFFSASFLSSSEDH